MATQTPDPHSNGSPDLPPVAPPSGRFIAQLFLIPGLIVTVLVLIILVSNSLVREKQTPSYFLDNLDSTNPDIRWRAAHDLAQVLKRPESIDMASDPKFALDLAERLEIALTDLIADEKQAADRLQKIPEKQKVEEARKDWIKLEAQRKHVDFLISALGDFTLPIGTPMLCRIAEGDKSPNVKGVTLRRRKAVWALTNLGENLKRYQELDEEKKAQIVETLKEEMEAKGIRSEWAQLTYQYLTQNASLGVDQTLNKCSRDKDRFLRSMVAVALNFWDGPEVEETLVRLSNDNGFGERLEIKE